MAFPEQGRGALFSGPARQYMGSSRTSCQPPSRPRENGGKRAAKACWFAAIDLLGVCVGTAAGGSPRKVPSDSLTALGGGQSLLTMALILPALGRHCWGRSSGRRPQSAGMRTRAWSIFPGCPIGRAAGGSASECFEDAQLARPSSPRSTRVACAPTDQQRPELPRFVEGYAADPSPACLPVGPRALRVTNPASTIGPQPDQPVLRRPKLAFSCRQCRNGTCWPRRFCFPAALLPRAVLSGGGFRWIAKSSHRSWTKHLGWRGLIKPGKRRSVAHRARLGRFALFRFSPAVRSRVECRASRCSSYPALAVCCSGSHRANPYSPTIIDATDRGARRRYPPQPAEIGSTARAGRVPFSRPSEFCRGVCFFGSAERPPTSVYSETAKETVKETAAVVAGAAALPK